MKAPKLSITLLTYNRSASGYLQEALEAILAQTYADFELLVLDNHSNDQTAELVMSYKDSRLTYVRQPPGCNGSFNFNRGLWMSRGEYFFATHDDDVMEPTLVERQMSMLAHNPELACVASNVSLIDERGDIIQPQLYRMGHDRLFEAGDYIPAYLDEKLWFPTPTCMFKRDTLIKKSGAIVRASKPRYIPSGDIGVLFLLNMRYPIGLLAEPLLRYRQHSGQESRNVHQSAPLVELVGLAEHLLKKRNRHSRLREHAPSIHGFAARFRAQNLLFSLPRPDDHPELMNGILNLKQHWEKKVAAELRAVDSVLPFDILLVASGHGSTIPAEHMRRLDPADADSGARRGYRHWAILAQRDRTLFGKPGRIKNIVVLGSMFTAFLLILEARRAGINVIGCIDSSPARIGNEIFGVPIVPHAELQRLCKTADAIILSNERDHDDALRQIVRSHLQGNDVPILSWKELAGTM